MISLQKSKHKIKKIILCIVPAQCKTAHIRVKGNEEADKAAKQIINMQGMTKTRLPYVDYYLTIGKTKTLNGKWSWKILLSSYITSNQTLKNGRVPTTIVSNMSWFRITQCIYQTNLWIFDDKKRPTANMYKRVMQKPDTNNQTLPCEVLPNRRTPEKIQYPE